MYKVLKTFLSQKTGTLFEEGTYIPEGYYTAEELKRAIKGGFVEAPKAEAKEESNKEKKAKATAKKEK